MKKDRFLSEIIDGEKPEPMRGPNTPRALVPKGKIGEVLGGIMQWYGRQEVKTPEECLARLEEYFSKTIESGSLPVIEELALALGTNVGSLHDWEVKRTKGNEVANLIKQARLLIATMDAKLACTGGIYHATYQFRAKNFYGMKDQQEFNITPGSPLGEAADPKELAAKYVEGLPDVEGGDEE